MANSTLAGIITAAASVFTALALLVTALTGWRKAASLARKVDEVHVMVNQQRTDAKNYQQALIAALNRAGVEVPADQSLGEITHHEPHP